MTGNALQIVRSTGGTATFSRSTDIANPAPTAIVYQWNLQKTAGTSAGTTSAILRVGSGFGTGNADETDGNTFGKVGLDQTGTSNTYQLRNIATGQLTPNITTNAQITWVLQQVGRHLQLPGAEQHDSDRGEQPDGPVGRDHAQHRLRRDGDHHRRRQPHRSQVLLGQQHRDDGVRQLQHLPRRRCSR